MRTRAVMLALALTLLMAIPVQAIGPSPQRRPDPVLDLAGSVDVPAWAIGDFWNYTTEFTYTVTIVIPINIPFSGWLNMTETLLSLDTVGNDPVHIIDVRGNITGHTTIPFYGDVWIYLSLTGYFWQRAQDLAVYRTVLNVTISGTESSLNGFYPFGYEYYPPMEEFDFPLIPGDVWGVRTTASIPFSPGTPGVEIDSQFGCNQLERRTVPAGAFQAYPVTMDGSPYLFYNSTVGNCVSREMSIDMSGIAMDVPLELDSYRRTSSSPITIKVGDPQPVAAGSSFDVEGTYDGIMGALTLFFPGGAIAYSGGVSFGPYSVTLTAPWTADDTPTMIDHASLGIFALVIGTDSGYSVCTVTTKATDLMVNDSMVLADPMGGGKVDDPIYIGVTVANPSNFGNGPFNVRMEFDGPSDVPDIEMGPYSTEAGSTVFLEGTIYVTVPGDYIVNVTVDPEDAVSEFNESNNAASSRFSVVPRSALVWTTSPTKEDQTIEEGSYLHIHASASRDGTDLTGKWLLDGSVVGTGQDLNFTASYIGPNSSEGSPYSISYVLDGGQTFADERSSANWTLTVEDVDRSPQLDSISPDTGTISVPEGTSVQFSVNVSDPDGDAIAYAWALDGIPYGSGAEWEFTARFTGENSSVGSPYNVSVMIGSNLFSMERYWTVVVVDVDRPFLLDAEPPEGVLTLRTGESITFKANISDPDGDDPLVRWSFLGDVVNATYVFTLVADELGLSMNTTFPVTLDVSSGEYSANRTWLVAYVHVPDVPPPEGSPPRNVTVVSPLAGYRYKVGDTVVLKANHTETRKVNFTWTLSGRTYYGQTVSVTGLLPGNYNVTLNASVAYPAPAWVLRTVPFYVIDERIENPQGDEEEPYALYAMIGILTFLVVFVAIALFLALRSKKEQAKEAIWEE